MIVWFTVFLALMKLDKCSIIYQVQLDKLQQASYRLSLQILNELSITCNMQIYLNQQSEQSLYYQDQCPGSNQSYLKQIQINNYQAQKIKFILKFSNQTVNQSITQVILSAIIVNENIITPSYIHSALLNKEQIEGYILPFNLLSTKTSKVIIQSNQLSINRISYSQQPFIETYWNEYGSDNIILTWLPYFSNCQYKTSNHLFLNDIIKPNYLNQSEKCSTKSDQFIIYPKVQCPVKSYKTICTLEKLNTNSTSNQWYENQQIPFYLFRQSLSPEQLFNYLQYKENLQNAVQNDSDILVPVQYKMNYNPKKQVPNHINLYLFAHFDQSIPNKTIINKAILEAEYNSTLFLQQNSQKLYSPLVELRIQVKYTENLQTILQSSYFSQYILYTLGFYIILFALFYILNSKLHLKPFQTLRKLLFPIAKGYTISFVKIFVFIALIYLFASSSNYDTVSTNFDTSTIQQDNTVKYRGRVGFTLFIAGFLMLNYSIGQSFKALSAEQTKIILQDDDFEKSLLKSRRNTVYNNQLRQQQKQKLQKEKSLFLMKNMNSHRKYILLYIFIFIVFILILIQYMKNRNLIQISLLFLVVLPIIYKILIIVFRHYFLKQMLYLFIFIAIFQGSTHIVYYNHSQLDALMLSILQVIGFNYINIALEVSSEYFILNASKYLKNNQQVTQRTTLYRLLNIFKQQIQALQSESKYQKTLYYTAIIITPIISKLVCIFLFPLQNLLILYTNSNKTFYLSKQQFIFRTAIISFSFIMIDFIVLLLNIKLFEKFLKLDISKNLQFQIFKFSNRKTNWINDQFALNSNLQHFYRQFQKFCMSSQLYLVVFNLIFSIYIIIISVIILIETQYIVYSDPVLLVILVVITLVGGLWELMFNFIVMKLKLYSRKQENKMRAKLESIQKILKRTDYTQYLEVEAVKDYFLCYCKKWIIQNFTKIFDSNDFATNNYQLLKKYKYYKNMLKKKKIEKKKLSNKNNNYNSNKDDALKDISSDEKHFYHAQSQQSSKIRDQNSVNSQFISKFQNYQQKKACKFADKNIVRLPQQQFQQLAKPVLYSWLYIAKQFVFLKKLVVHIKEQKIKSTCQMCSMNIQLEAIEKTEFHDLVNQYRILNVGRSFVYQHFINFYKEKQQYITVCFQCKQKNLHLQKKRIDLSGLPIVMMKKWLFSARSRLLHRKQSIEQSKNRGISVSKQATQL